MTINKEKPELLAPAGNFEKCRIALRYGADAVYLAGKNFGLRAFSDNFTLDEMAEAVRLAHAGGQRVYVTVNMMPHDEDMAGLPEYIAALSDLGADAIILSDLGVWRVARRVAPKLPFHVSTQANTVNREAVLAWQELGAKRIVLARELSVVEMAAMRPHVQTELEAFVHGAMCVSLSGRCLLSQYLTGRDANRGACAQPCRWRYSLIPEGREAAEALAMREDANGTYIMNSRDLCALPVLPTLLSAGIDSLKIEGRMKSLYYVAMVTSVYRAAVDAWRQDPEHFSVDEAWQRELAAVSHRPYTTGFYTPHEEAMQVYGNSSYQQTHEFIALALSYDAGRKAVLVEQRNNFVRGQNVEFVQPNGAKKQFVVSDMWNENGELVDKAPHPQQRLWLAVPESVMPDAILRRES